MSGVFGGKSEMLKMSVLYVRENAVYVNVMYKLFKRDGRVVVRTVALERLSRSKGETFGVCVKGHRERRVRLSCSCLLTGQASRCLHCSQH